MSKKKEKLGSKNEEMFDSYESWLERQPVIHAKAKPGFSMAKETGEEQ
jgi:hypothetical protein